jgi:arsenate reductase-like glutaredoxin family protein
MEKENQPFVFRDLKKEPLTLDELTSISRQVGLNNLINKKGTTWRKSGLSEKNPTEQELLHAALENQSMLIRPLIQRDKNWLTGYDEEAFKTLLS